jgi:phage shock protein A
MRVISRFVNLIRGAVGHWLGDRERKHPGAVYEAAIQGRLQQYGQLREAAAGVIYMRSKLAREVSERTRDLALIARQLELAVERDQDDAAVALLVRREGLRADVERLTKDLDELTAEAETAKKNLIAFQQEVVRLRDEKHRALARLANAKARLRLQETLKGLSPEADIQALEDVRAYVDRLAAEVQVSREVGDAELAKKLDTIREAETTAAAQAQLQELKRARRERALVPVRMPQPVSAVAAS